MMKLIVGVAAIAAALTPLQAVQAQDATATEFRSLATCAATYGVYKSLLESAKSPPAPQKALYARAEKVENRLATRTNALAAKLGEDRASAVFKEIAPSMKSRLELIQRDPAGIEKGLNSFEPDLKACIARAEKLPAG